MKCDDVRPRLTAYLDGDLDADRGTVIRGHLRACEACRSIAEQEAALRDGLRAMPTLDPPPALWANIQAQLAAAEVEESNQPAWKRTFARWMRAGLLPRFAAGGALAAAAVAVLVWRTTHDEPVVEQPTTKLVDTPSPDFQSSRTASMPTPPMPSGCQLAGPSDADVTADLAADAERMTSCYAQTATELLALANDARPRWTDDERTLFDANVRELRGRIDNAPAGRPRQRAWRALNRYLQRTITRDDIVLAGGTP
jgi:hypothetical protein